MASEAGAMTSTPVELTEFPPPDRDMTAAGTEAPRYAV